MWVDSLCVSCVFVCVNGQTLENGETGEYIEDISNSLGVIVFLGDAILSIVHQTFKHYYSKFIWTLKSIRNSRWILTTQKFQELHTCNFSVEGDKAEELLWVEDQPGLHSDFQASWHYSRRPCFKTKTQQVKVFIGLPDNLSSVSGPHMVEREGQFLKVIHWPQYGITKIKKWNTKLPPIS